MSNPIGSGDRVQCVDASSRPGKSGWYPGSAIYVGRIYTVREVGPCDDGTPGLRLVEVTLTAEGQFRDNFYCASRFRPIRDFKNQIEAFKKINADVFGRVTA